MFSDPLGIQEAHEIATSELAIDCQVEEGEVTSFSGKLELCPLGPDMFGLKGRALFHSLALKNTFKAFYPRLDCNQLSH